MAALTCLPEGRDDMWLFERLLTARAGPTIGYDFTERVRQVLAMAREEAARLRHEHIGTEHILLGLLREGEGVARAVIANLEVDAGRLRERTLDLLGPGAAPRKPGPDVPYTAPAKKVLEQSKAAARELHHSYIGTEHLLLGLLREEHGIGARVLVDHGVTLAAARTETVRLLGNDAPAGPPG